MSLPTRPLALGAAPVVASAGSSDPAAPLVVLLHGRGSSEADIIGLADHLPVGAAYAAVRAPIPAGGGYAWFANRGIGRPVEESLRQTMAWFTGWLDTVAPPGRPVILVGFSGGAAFAGGPLLDDPHRFAGAAILYGTLPFDAGVPVTPARLAEVPVFVAHGENDTLLPPLGRPPLATPCQRERCARRAPDRLPAGQGLAVPRVSVGARR